LSETLEEKIMRRGEIERNEMEKTRKPFESTALSSADENDAVSSAVLSVLKCVDSYANPKVKRAPFVVAEAEEDIGTGSRLSKEAA
jgi:hypothetical protein